MKTKSCKAKGRKLCQEVRELLFKYAPDLKLDDIRVTPSGCVGEDLLLSPAARQIYQIIIEGKNQESLNIWAALKQAESHKKDPDSLAAPVVFFRRNHSRIYVALGAEDFIRLVR